MGEAKAAVHNKDGKVAVEKIACIVGKFYYTESASNCNESIVDGKDSVHAIAKAADKDGNSRFIDSCSTYPLAKGVGKPWVAVNGDFINSE